MVDAGKGVPSSRHDRVVGEPLAHFDPISVGPYRLLSRIGVGGMGTVYQSRNAAGMSVAVKVIRPDLAADPEFRRRFRAEVEAARRVAPFCTAEVLDADPDAYQPYMVTEFIDGIRLDQEISERGPLSPSNLTGTAVGVATALIAIHGAGLVHRDLKPSNVILSLSGPRVIDFGISQALEGSVARPTQWGFGSSGWMAPEQVHGEPIGPAADVFTWGILMAYAGTGHHPFGEGTDVDLTYRIVNSEPNLDGMPAGMLDLVRAALAKRPESRPTARELVLQLVERRPDAASPGLIGTAEQALGLKTFSRTGAHEQRPPNQAQPFGPPAAYPISALAAPPPGGSYPYPPGGDGPPTPPTPPTRPRWRRRGVALALGVLLLVAVAIAMIVTLPSGDGTEPATSGSSPSRTPSPSPSRSPATKVGRDGAFAFRVIDDRCGQDGVDGWPFPPTKGEFCVVDVEVRNVGGRGLNLFVSGQQTLIDQDGERYQAGTWVGFFDQPLGEGDVVTRKLVFDVPEGTKPTSVVLQDNADDKGVTIPI